MSPKPLNPNAKPFFHFPSKTNSKPLNPCANPFQIQTYLCNLSWQWRPFIPKNHYKVTPELPSVRSFVEAMNHPIPVSWSKQHHLVSGPVVQVWKPKLIQHKDQRNDKLSEKKRSSKGNVIPFPSCSADDQKSSCTTVMIKNIPNQFRRTDLVNILRSHCRQENKKSAFKSEFDFVYLPMDFQKYWKNKRVANLGYAFVNFTSHVAALRFFRYYHNRDWNVKLNNKICQVTSAKLQGKEALLGQFENSVFWCHTDIYLPALLEPACDGDSLPKLINIGCRVCAPSWRPRRKAQ